MGGMVSVEGLASNLNRLARVYQAQSKNLLQSRC